MSSSSNIILWQILLALRVVNSWHSNFIDDLAFDLLFVNLSVFVEQLTLLSPVIVELIASQVIYRLFGLVQSTTHVCVPADSLSQRVKHRPFLYEYSTTEIFLVVDFSKDARFKSSLAVWTLDQINLFNKLLVWVSFWLVLERILLMFLLNGLRKVTLA